MFFFCVRRTNKFLNLLQSREKIEDLEMNFFPAPSVCSLYRISVALLKVWKRCYFGVMELSSHPKEKGFERSEKLWLLPCFYFTPLKRWAHNTNEARKWEKIISRFWKTKYPVLFTIFTILLSLPELVKYKPSYLPGNSSIKIAFTFPLIQLSVKMDV